MADDYPTHIFGVDFSGAADAGKYIWITEGNSENGCLLITDCRSASDFLNVSPQRDLTIPALAEFIESRRYAAFGLDFPFGLPKSMVDEGTWFRFATSFSTRFSSIEDFDIECHSASSGKEWKRLCDIETKAPFSPYNRRVMHQTYYGIRDLLQPLVSLGKISVPPILLSSAISASIGNRNIDWDSLSKAFSNNKYSRKLKLVFCPSLKHT